MSVPQCAATITDRITCFIGVREGGREEDGKEEEEEEGINSGWIRNRGYDFGAIGGRSKEERKL